MIDPSDITLKIFDEGDDTILPTSTGGEFGEVPYTNYHALPGHMPRMFRNFYRTLTSANNKVVIRPGDRPGYWRVKLDSTAGCKIFVYLGSDAGGDPIPVETSEAVILPGLPDDYNLTLLWVVGAAVNVTVFAERGYDIMMVAD